MIIDYRSDTVTRPTPAMLDAMLSAETGDDVFGEDPTVNKLESKVASIFNMNAALFCPSGTMTNQIAIKCHTQPGDEVICDELSHIYQYEGGGIAFNAGCSVKLLKGDLGRITPEQVESGINNKEDNHKPFSSLVSLENTCNRGGGSCYDFHQFKNIKKICVNNQLKLHLDGARIFNAIVYKKELAADYGEVFDSISLCLSKGLGSPVGSVLIGNSSFIKKARRYRKIFGGGMRQAGILAAAGIFALDNNIARLEQDHKNAKELAAILEKKNFVESILPVETNIVIFKMNNSEITKLLQERLKAQNILVIAITPTQIRMVTHLDITPALFEKTINTIKAL